MYSDQEDQSEPECMPHGHRWRSRFQCILNQLRDNKESSKFDKGAIDKIPQAICTCTQSPTDYQTKLVPDPRWEEFTEEEYKTAEVYFDNYLNTLDKSTEYYSLLRYHFNALQVHRELQEKSSSRRFLLVFQKIHQSDGNDKELLKRVTKSSNPSGAESRLRETVHLQSLKGEYVPLFCGRNGKNMKRYLKGRKKVKVELEVKDDKVYASITCKESDKEKIVERLKKEADLLAERRHIHEQNQREYRERHGNDTMEEDDEDVGEDMDQ